MTLKELNKAVCGLVKRAAEASGLGAELMAEDLSAPIQRPSLKVELEEDRDARAIRHRVEQAITFRVYFFAADQYRPKLDNLAMRQALAEAFRDGVPVGLSFTVPDGVLVASMDLTLDQRIIPAEEEDAELMEELNVNLEVH